jgi:peptidoglycan/LPS O-acetylase OafA/YrhL
VQKREIGGLDLLRFLAALIVTVYHLGFSIWAVPNQQAVRAAGALPAMQGIEPFAHFGWVGVEIFFVISGFVIAFSASGGISPARFVRGRVLRLVPAVLILAPVSAAAMWISGGQGRLTILKNLVRSLVFSPFAQWVDPVYWTLGIEVVFYACIAVLLVARRFDQWIEPFAALIGIMGLIYWSVSSLFPIADAIPPRMLDLTLMQHGPLFAIGVLFWASWQRGITGRRATLIVVFSGAAILQICHRAAGLAVKHGTITLLWPAVMVWGVSMLLIILALRYQFGGKTIRQIGLMTYPLYLLHDVTGAAIIGWLIRGGTSPYAALGIVMASVIAASWLVAAHVEPAVRKGMARALDRIWPGADPKAPRPA